MKNLTIGPSYFRNERRVYADWQVAVFTEILQNAIDARSSEIHIDIVEQEENVKIIARDNGIGMTREIAENVFLVVGESSKANSCGDTIGGYGIARNLIAFGMESYVIRSHNYVIRGSGASYEIEESEQFVKGCIFEIQAEKADWEYKLRQVINYSSFSPRLYVNNKLFVSNLHRGKHIRDLSFGQVYVNKSAVHGLYVRCKGLKMFEKYTSVNARIFIEIDPSKARDVLTSNRNELKYEQSKELQAFLNELACDSRSSLRDKTRHYKRLVNPGTGFKALPKQIGLKITDRGGMESQGKEQDILQKLYVDIKNREYSSNFISPENVFISPENVCDDQALATVSKDPLLEAMMILNESNDPKRVQLINNFYHPERWNSRAGTRYQLLREWFAVCQIVMDEMANWTKKEYSYSVGWVFSDEEAGEGVEAKWVKDNDINYLLINPIDMENKLKYSVNNKNDWYALITLACHECTHASGKTYHDEDFSSFFTSLQIKVLARVSEIFSAIKEAKNN